MGAKQFFFAGKHYIKLSQLIYIHGTPIPISTFQRFCAKLKRGLNIPKVKKSIRLVIYIAEL